MKKNNHFDYLFIGAGASTTLLLHSLESRGLLMDKKIAIFDPDTKVRNDKTFCFWTNSDDPIHQEFKHLYSKTWTKISVNLQKPEKLNNMHYAYISGLAINNECRRIIDQYQLVRHYHSVSQINSTEEGLQLITENGMFEAEFIFDSRPPSFLKPKKNEAILQQTFLGYVISPEKLYEQEECADLMDFNIPQNGFTQFMYVLPLAKNRILVEITRFGTEPITEEQAKPLLDNYIHLRFGQYTILEIESGNIPMSTAKMSNEKMKGLIPIGGRSGAIKPSTGYAFKKMFEGAEQIAEQLMTKKEINSTIHEPSRFQFYDRLLLLILSHHPSVGRQIFTSLFRKNKVASVFRFLEGKTIIFRDIQILSTLPFRPFLKVLKIELNVSLNAFITPFCVLILALSLLFLQLFSTNLSLVIQAVLFLIGFLSVGLPHGAVDHILESGMHAKGFKMNFVFKYLGSSFIFLMIWYLSANSALFLFLAFSIWHFGQGDFREWDSNQSNIGKSILWGGLLFGILLIGHQKETNTILERLNVVTIPFNEVQAWTIAQCLIIFSLCWSIFLRKGAFFLTVCTLLISIHLPLVSAFALYFIFQHSLNGWRHLKVGLNTDNKTLFQKALPFNLAAIVLLVITYWISNKYISFYQNFNLIPIFFVFLSCISFPHVIRMNHFYKKRYVEQILHKN